MQWIKKLFSRLKKPEKSEIITDDEVITSLIRGFEVSLINYADKQRIDRETITAILLVTGEVEITPEVLKVAQTCSYIAPFDESTGSFKLSVA